MNNTGLTKEITHQQWGAPMSYHVLVRAEHDLIIKDSFLTFASYYNKDIYTKGGMSMAHTTIRIPDSKLSTQEEYINAVIKNPDNELSGGKLDVTAVTKEENTK